MSSVVIVFTTSMRYWVMALGFSPQPSHLLGRRLKSAWFLAVGFASTSCSGGGDGPGIVNPPLPVPAVVHVWIVSQSNPPGIPGPPQPFSIGIIKQAYALAQDAAGNTLSGPVTWSSTNPDVVTVNDAGQVKLVAPGTARITATILGTTGGVDVTVLPTLVASVSVYIPTIIGVGDSAQATAVVRDAGNNVLTRSVTWSSGYTAVATVSAAGLVRGVSGGTAAIEATVEGVSGFSVLTVFGP